jgi:transcriptional regulator with PAS, ATPase and Fis domain
MREVETMARRVAASDATVLITGESGTGKEVVARYIHRCGNRAGAPFVKVNCAALPDPLLESELFGYEKGAFTGADSRKPGRLETAHGGIVLLDEISEISLGLQAKLLQVLEAKSFHRLGGVDEIKVDVQIIAATNRNLEEAISAGRFRNDLYFRLKVIELHLPPLEERRDDIPRLVDYFLCRLSRQYSQPVLTLSPTVLDALRNAPWKGNVRELENAIRRLVILGDEDLLLKELGGDGRYSLEADRASKSVGFDLGSAGRRAATTPTPPPASLDLKEAARGAARRAERDAILTALNQTRWNRTQAARLLGVSYKTLLTKMKDLLPPGPTPD